MKLKWEETMRYRRWEWVPGMQHLFQKADGLWVAICGSPNHQYMIVKGKRNSDLPKCKSCLKLEPEYRRSNASTDKV